MTRRRGVAASRDRALRLLADSVAPVCTIVGKTWTLHLEKVVRVDREENLKMIAQSIGFLRRQGKRVDLRRGALLRRLSRRARVRPGAASAPPPRPAPRRSRSATRTAPRCPSQVAAATRDASRRSATGVRVGIHCHNDAECGVANTIAAVEAGARQVQGTINGCGERTGNANLVSIIANLQLKLGFRCLADDQLARLTETAHFVDEILNVRPDPNQPYVGRNAFAHKGGMHVAGVAADATPSSTSTRRSSATSASCWSRSWPAAASMLEKASELGIELDKATAARVIGRVKQLEHEGYQFEAADGSLELLLRRETGGYEPLFTLESWRVIVEQRADGAVQTEATVKIWLDGERRVQIAEGNGPVNALDRALRAAIG